jgi:hypothetical protein
MIPIAVAEKTAARAPAAIGPTAISARVQVIGTVRPRLCPVQLAHKLSYAPRDLVSEGPHLL